MQANDAYNVREFYSESDPEEPRKKKARRELSAGSPRLQRRVQLSHFAKVKQRSGVRFVEEWRMKENSEQKIAIKFANETDVDEIRGEFGAVLSCANHESIVQATRFVRDVKRKLFGYAMEYLNPHEFTTLNLRMSEKSDSWLANDGKTVKSCFKKIIQGVEHCHKNNIVHRQLTLEHVLVNHDASVVKIIGFGLSANDRFKPVKSQFTGAACYDYFAPERLDSTPKDYDEKVDIWSCGVLLFELICGCRPFSSHNTKSVAQVLSDIKASEYKFSPRNSPSECLRVTALTELIASMLQRDPKDRPTASEVLQSEWLKPQVGVTLDENDDTSRRQPWESPDRSPEIYGFLFDDDDTRGVMTPFHTELTTQSPTAHLSTSWDLL